jgi:hypothetical protein
MSLYSRLTQLNKSLGAELIYDKLLSLSSSFVSFFNFLLDEKVVKESRQNDASPRSAEK